MGRCSQIANTQPLSSEVAERARVTMSRTSRAAHRIGRAMRGGIAVTSSPRTSAAIIGRVRRRQDHGSALDVCALKNIDAGVRRAGQIDLCGKPRPTSTAGTVARECGWWRMSTTWAVKLEPLLLSLPIEPKPTSSIAWLPQTSSHQSGHAVSLPCRTRIAAPGWKPIYSTAGIDDWRARPPAIPSLCY